MDINQVDISKLPADVRKKFRQLQVMYAEKKIRNKARNDLPHSACFVYTKYLKKLDIPKDVITWD